MPAAGWYLDVEDSSRQRWWDGTAWTLHARVLEPTSLTPVSISAPSSEPAALTRRQLRERVGPLTVGAPGVVEPHPNVAVLDRPLDMRPREPAPDATVSSAELLRRAGGYAPREPVAADASYEKTQPVERGRTQTLSGWFFAFAPLWMGGTSLLVGVFLPFLDSRTAPVASLILAVVLTFGLAWTDGRRLRANGYRPTSPGWVLVPLVYFILRVVRVGARSVPMLVTWVLLESLIVVSAVWLVAAETLAVTSLPSSNQSQSAPNNSHDPAASALTDDERAYLLTPAGVDESMRYSFTGGGQTVGTLSCLPFASTAADTLTTCVIEVDGSLYDVLLRISPEYPDAAFVVKTVALHGSNAGVDSVQS